MTETAGISFGQLVDRHAAERPDAVAVDSVESGPHPWAELHEVGVRLCNGLAGLGVGPGDPVLTMLPADFENLAVWAACSRLRAVEVPVNHAYRGVWLKGVIERIGARIAVVDAQFWPNWEAVVAGTPLDVIVVAGGSDQPSIEGVRTVSYDEVRRAEYDEGSRDEARPDDLAIVMHTSGTTGVSKGVMLPWSALWFRVNQQHMPNLTRGHGTAYYAPFGPFHWTGRGRWYEMAVAGYRLVTRHSFKTDQWLSDIRRHGCTQTALVGTMQKFVNDSPVRPDDADNPLELVNMGPILPDVDAFMARFAVVVAAAYSMTEIPYAFVTRDGHVVSNATAKSCGVNDPSVPIRVVREDGEPVALGEVGELLVGGDRTHVNAGYYNMPAETEKAWEGGWFHTGDLFRFDEAGRYYFLDRAKDALRRRGENISSMEIETIFNAHAAVRESAVIGVPSEYGEDEVKVVIVADGTPVDPAELIAFVRPQIAEFAVPRYVEYVDELPKTVTSKIQKAVLREHGVNDRTWDRLQVEPSRVSRRSSG